MASLGGADWRAAYLEHFPDAATWITTEHPDHAGALADIQCPTLLIWGDSDPISPPAVGDYLSSLIPRARLSVIAGGTHDLGRERASMVAPLICEHLTDGN